ncbi:MAG: PDZ domain-containing protein [Planctomycetaceae bacterium]|nr:PDZ domain-containing protein [Planctomycetaceae bacterium]
MRFSIMILVLLLVNFCGEAMGWGQTPPPATSDVKFWAGIITQKPDHDDRSTIFMVPKRENANGVEITRYETQSTRPLTIRRVMLDSPASRSGLLPGDTLLKFNQQALSTHADLVTEIQANGNETATLLIARAGKELAVELTPIRRPDDYADRVRADRAAEAADQAAGKNAPESDLVELPGNLSGLLSLAAKNNSSAQASQEVVPLAPQNSEPSDMTLPPGANFDRSTRLLIDKLEQFSKEWSELLDRQKQSLNDLKDML